MQTVSIEAKIFLESEFRQIVITLASLVGLFDAVFVCLFCCPSRSAIAYCCLLPFCNCLRTDMIYELLLATMPFQCFGIHSAFFSPSISNFFVSNYILAC